MNRKYFAVRNRVGFLDLSGRGKIEVSGKDRHAFLHGVLTQDIKNLKPGEGRPAALLDPEGRLIADFHLFAFEEFLLIDCQAVLVPEILGTLGKYLITEDVTLTDRANDFAWLGIEGPRAPDLLSRLIEEKSDFLAPGAHTGKLIKNIPVHIFRFSFSGERGFYFLLKASEKKAFSDSIFSEGRAFEMEPLDESSFQILRVEAGLPWHGTDFDKKTLFPETGLENAVCYTKGCYLGQEAVAKIKNTGGPEKKLTGFVLDGPEPPLPPQKLFSKGQEAGYLTSIVFSPALEKTISLGYLLKDSALENNRAEVGTVGSKIFARVHALPFFRRT